MNAALLINLLIASFLSALLYVILKFFQVYRINNLQGLTFNYFTASALSFTGRFEHNLSILDTSGDFLQYALLIGALFILVFYCAALTAQHAGITVTSIAGKMSMIIPISVGILVFHDRVYPLRIAGMLIAMAAVLMSTFKGNSSGDEVQQDRKLKLILPLLLFAGSGLVDTCIKLSEHYLITEDNQELYISFLFGSAAIIGFMIMLYSWVKHHKKPGFRSVLAGILLGTTNYFSLVFLIKVLSSPGVESSLAFAMTNVMVVLISTVIAMLVFKEKLNRMNMGGLALAIISIVILSF
ncbi:MAG: hypothetical protein JNL88_10390 [Bacteroidia bacterium]|nr:hypothetical protein [Bacteroidia bacterium]